MKKTRKQKMDRQRGHAADRAFDPIRAAIDRGEIRIGPGGQMVDAYGVAIDVHPVRTFRDSGRVQGALQRIANLAWAGYGESRECRAMYAICRDELRVFAGYGRPALPADTTRDALLAALQEKEWQPIEKAPTNDRSVIVAFLQRSGEWWIGEAYLSSDAGAWYAMNNDPSDPWGGPIYPTHWMPLPNPPAALSTLLASGGRQKEEKDANGQ